MEWLPCKGWPSDPALLGLEETNEERNYGDVYNCECKERVNRNQLFAVTLRTRYRGVRE